jgi:hypothetical protein
MRPHGETYFDIEEYAKQLNAEVDEHSSIHGESWSQQFATGIEEGKSLANDFNLATLSASIWYDENDRPLEDLEHEYWEK